MKVEVKIVKILLSFMLTTTILINLVIPVVANTVLDDELFKYYDNEGDLMGEFGANIVTDLSSQYASYENYHSIIVEIPKDANWDFIGINIATSFNKQEYSYFDDLGICSKYGYVKVKHLKMYVDEEGSDDYSPLLIEFVINDNNGVTKRVVDTGDDKPWSDLGDIIKYALSALASKYPYLGPLADAFDLIKSLANSDSDDSYIWGENWNKVLHVSMKTGRILFWDKYEADHGSVETRFRISNIGWWLSQHNVDDKVLIDLDLEYLVEFGSSGWECVYQKLPINLQYKGETLANRIRSNPEILVSIVGEGDQRLYLFYYNILLKVVPPQE